MPPTAAPGPATATTGDAPPLQARASRTVKSVSGHQPLGEGSTSVISVITIVLPFVGRWVVTKLGWLLPRVLPAPEAVGGAFVASVRGELQGGKTLCEPMDWSFARVFGAFFLACLTAIPIGILMGVSRIARGVFDPPLEFYRPLLPLADLPPVIIGFGIDEASKIVLIGLACFAPLAVAARAGVRSVTTEPVNAAYSMGALRARVIWHVILAAALPEIPTGMRIAIGIGWATLVAAEMVAATAGFGPMAVKASNFLRTDSVIMGIVVIGFWVDPFDKPMRRVEAPAAPWNGGTSRLRAAPRGPRALKAAAVHPAQVMRDRLFVRRHQEGLRPQGRVRKMSVSAILDGHLPPASPVPSSRDLADALGVGRNAVVLADQQMVAEAYLLSRERSGHVVDPDITRGRVPLAPPPATESGVEVLRLNVSAPDQAARYRLRRTTQRNIVKPVDWLRHRNLFLCGQFDTMLCPTAWW